MEGGREEGALWVCFIKATNPMDEGSTFMIYNHITHLHCSQLFISIHLVNHSFYLWSARNDPLSWSAGVSPRFSAESPQSQGTPSMPGNLGQLVTLRDQQAEDESGGWHEEHGTIRWKLRRQRGDARQPPCKGTGRVGIGSLT